jgi:segregation and condensation protein A
MPLTTAPIVNLPAFEGPLDLLLHLIREQRLDIADIPIVMITDQYLAIIAESEDRKLAIAGEFFVMAATLLEIKTRMLLPRPPAMADDEAEDDPRADLAERLLEYERFKGLVPMLQEWEQDRARCFLRNVEGIDELYDGPILFGQASPQALLKAFERILERAAELEPDVTSVHRKKLSLHLAMRLMMARVAEAGPTGIDFLDLFPAPLVLFDVVMTFLALLELLRQRKLEARQIGSLAPIHVHLAAPELAPNLMDAVRYSSGNVAG